MSNAPRLDFCPFTARAPSQATIDFTVALRLRNVDALESLFWEISNPQSASYKNYQTVESLAAQFSPDLPIVNQVAQWLKSNLKPTHIAIPLSRNAIKVIGASVSSVENLFGIQLHKVQSKRGTTLLRCVNTLTNCALSVPTEMGKLIHSIEGLVDFPSYESRQIPAPTATDINITPSQLFVQYALPKQSSVNSNLTAQAVAEFSGSNWLQSYSPADLSAFQRAYNLLVQPIAKLYGKNDPTAPTGEATLDIQYIMAAAQGVPTWFWGETGSYLDYLLHIENEKDGPLVHSISYSIGEESYLDVNHMNLLNSHFQLIAATGKSLIWASGDEGTGNTGMFGCGQFSPGFPATSPYVTSVGATSLTNPGSTGSSIQNTAYGEHAASYSGGGFSAFFPRPSYQALAVKSYLTSLKVTLPPSSYYNASGRGFPDVSVAGTNYITYVGAMPMSPVSGTSAATPVFSAMLAMINNELAARGRKPVGFSNVALYQAPSSVWTPITSGNNACYPCDVGFFAAAPWAPISGLGSPNYPALLNYFLSLSK